MKADFEQIKRVLGRCLRLRCPACGESTIVTQPFHIRHHCPNCMALFKREEGFFVGAILANVVTTELVILLVCFFFLLVDWRRNTAVCSMLLFVMALLFPVLFIITVGVCGSGSTSSSSRCRNISQKAGRSR